MLNKFRKSTTLKGFAVFLVINMLGQIIFPTAAFALGGGPSQTEFQNFEPVGTSEMVNLASGDFTYNIPLLDVDGYPINLSYHTGISMDQEASWLGLGWNINPGSIARGMRGLPDDFAGDVIEKKINIRDNITYGARLNAGFETIGFPGPNFNLGMGVFYNNYKGVGFDFSKEVGFATPLAGPLTVNFGYGVSANSQEGMDIGADIGLSVELGKKSSVSVGVNAGASYSSRGGIKNINLGSSLGFSKGGVNVGTSQSGSVPIGTQSYVPTITVPTNGFGFNFSFKGGTSAFVIFPYTGVDGWYSKQSLASKSINKAAYGYLYAHEGAINPFSLKDFNREKDGVFHTTMNNLPLTNHTYDIFSVTGQGIAGMYRPYRSEVGTVSDPFMKESSSDNSFSGELGVGWITHIGANYNYTTTQNTSGEWKAGNLSTQFLKYRDRESNGVDDELYEPAYFKRAGELTTRDDNYYANIGGNNPLRLDLLRGKTDITGLPSLSGVSAAKQFRTKRVQRNQNFSYLTAEEAKTYGLSSKIENYQGGLFSTIERNAAYRNNKHLSEITVLREDGARYIYGIPAYNTKQEDVTFNVTGRTPSCSTGLVNYVSGVDNSINNELGMDQYFESTTTPAYAHSYMLTAIVSPEYVDVTGNGLSKDDLGNYTKFNYAKNLALYNWRVPIEEDKAIFNGGYRSDSEDNKGSYIYGQKEVWYLHSVETKNYIAKFNLSPRKDGVGVADENGGLGTSNQQLSKLDNIQLYTQKDQVTPIKVVHFEYDYSLCPNVPNNGGANAGISLYDYNNDGTLDDINTNKGKLTLKKVYFTYGNSAKGQLNPYVFHYADADHNGPAGGVPEAALNPPYNIKGYDRWGTYKKQESNVACGTNQPLGGTLLGNDEFPYTEQSNETNTYAGAWCLNTIELPSGSVLEVDYESDDYAYVQNKRAQQMYPVLGVSKLLGGTPVDDLDGSNFVVIQVPAGTTSQDLLGEENDAQLYFKFMVNILNEKSDYVPGYADVLSCTVLGTKAYIRLAQEPINDNSSGTQVSPISKATYQMVRNSLQRVLYPANSNTGFSMATFTNIVSNFLTDAQTLVKGINKTLKSKGIGETFTPSHSWVRLQNIAGDKKGGGVRVKQITMNDGWDEMVTSENDSEYGQFYDYSLSGDGSAMSSGVASYEPLTGGDENPFRKPIPYSVDRNFYDNSVMFQEDPYGESLFPGANVVYSKVTVRNIAHTNVHRNATGKTEYEFYTANDFPIIKAQTGMDKKEVNPGFINKLFSKTHRYKFAASQGYSIELNDMHGKPKAKKSYAEGGLASIEGIEYKYQRNGSRLVNTVDVIDNTNKISHKTIGEEIDVVIDSRKQKSTTKTRGVLGGYDDFVVPFAYINIPHVWISNSKTEREFKSSVSTKVIQKYGVLEEVVVYDQNSKVTTKNKLYDEATGKVLLTETINEFDDKLYAFNYPAHWGYEGMEQASKNIDAIISLSTNGSGRIVSNTDNLTPGDELIGLSALGKIWITSSEATGHLYAVDNAGEKVSGLTNEACKIGRSGKRNLHSMSMGNVVSRKNPIVANSIAPDVVLNANAIEYSDKWGTEVFNKDVYSTECAEQQTYELTCFDNTRKNDLLMFLNDMLQTNVGTGGKFLFEDGYYMSATGSSVNPLLNGLNYADLTVCEANLTNSGSLHSLNFNIVDESSINIVFSSNLYQSVAYHANFAAGCFYQTALLLNLSGTFPSGYNMTSINDFSNIQVNPNGSFTVEADLGGGSVIILNGRIGSHLNNVSLRNCTASLSSICEGAVELETIVNPYVKGIRGNYRAHKAYAYNTIRDQSGSDIREDGTMNTIPFWGYNSSGNEWLNIFNVDHPQYSATNGESWVLNSEVTKYNASGNQLESKDALGRYSAAQYGYNNTMAVAEVFNSKYTNFGFDGFEDSRYYSPGCVQNHFGWEACYVDDEDAHTGRYSLKLPASSGDLTLQVPIDMGSCESSSVHSVPYAISCADDNGLFIPETGGKYIFSCWIKEKDTPPDVLIYTKPSISILGNNITVNNIKHSRIIDGWQKVEYTFKVSEESATGNKLTISLSNYSSETVYFDDVRIQPFNSTMNAYVYDPISLRLWAELDDRNFATFYEYDEEGTLVRVKKETSKGIKTIQENRAGVKK